MEALKILLVISVLFISCENSDSDVEIDPNLTYEFNGNFITTNQSGAIFLRIESERYYCTTDLPYGRGAGRLAINNNEIEFIDTLFFPIPALYGPSWVLSGKHKYTFNGSVFKLSRKIDDGIIYYDLTKAN
jgi:hypothetical protein